MSGEPGTNRESNPRIKVTAEMIDAGESVLLCELGGAVSSFWYPRDLAEMVSRAMASHANELHPDSSRSRVTR